MIETISYQTVFRRSVGNLAFTKDEEQALRKERILITGAGGSIGSVITEKLHSIGVEDFLATDRDESSLHALSLRISRRALFDNQNLFLLDIRDKEGVNECFSNFQPTTVIHAAALKHLSALELQPREAILTNTFGTLSVVNAALSVGTSRFINISTDKAANPTSVLGKSKFLAELITLDARQQGGTNFKSVRFGNVFNSRGSVIETFVYQLMHGTPITLTSSEATRFFMSKEEAAFLSIKSALLSEFDVNIFSMGESVKLLFIVHRLMEILGIQGSVVETGLRPGEKLQEELFLSGSKLFKTQDPRIFGINTSMNSRVKEHLVDMVKSNDLKRLMYTFHDPEFSWNS